MSRETALQYNLLKLLILDIQLLKSLLFFLPNAGSRSADCETTCGSISATKDVTQI